MEIERIPALGEGADQVERRRRLAVGLDHTLRVGLTPGGVEIEAVDDVAAIGRQRHLALLFDVGRARLGELPGEPPDLDHRHPAAKGQHHRHLQQHLEHVADVVGVELGEAFGAIAALQQERLALRDGREPLLQAPRLAGENEGRVVAQRVLDAAQRAGIGISRDLADRPVAPARQGPGIAHRAPPWRRASRLSRVGWDIKNLRFGGHSTRATTGSCMTMKHESRLGRAASGNTQTRS